MKYRIKNTYLAQIIGKRIDGKEFEIVGFYQKKDYKTRDVLIEPYEEVTFKVYQLKNENGKIVDITESLFSSIMEVM